MSLDRTIAPPFQNIQTVRFPALQKVNLDNQLPLHVINLGQQPVVRMEIVFEAGLWYDASTPTASFFTTKMLSEGTKYHNSVQISEHFDSVGAFLELGTGYDRINITVYGLKKHLAHILTLLKEMIFEATFPQKELNDIKNSVLQGLKINLEKNAYLANNLMRAHVFGKKFPYAYSQKEEDITHIESNDLQQFYQNYIQNKPFSAFLSGQVGEEEIALVNQFLGQHNWQEKQESSPNILPYSTIGVFHTEKPDAIQSSVRAGRLLFTRKHPDFYPFIVCNEILGGYFGSRLMKNIREDKGYTYGVSSNLVPISRVGYWAVAADVKKEHRQATFNEIEKEIRLLQTELVPEEELETVKNYMAGSFAGSLNTPFEVADRVKLMVLENLSLDFYSNHIQNIRQIRPEQILEMAKKYLNFNDLVQVSVG